jgi:hypothetical protein
MKKIKDIIYLLFFLVALPLLVGFSPEVLSNSNFGTIILYIIGFIFYFLANFILKRVEIIKNKLTSILIRIFYTYFYLIIFMGSMYFTISQNDPKAFVFVNEMRNKENKVELINQKYDKIIKYNEKIYLINKLLEKSDSVYPVIKKTKLKSIIGNGRGFEKTDSLVDYTNVGDLKFKFYQFCPYDTINKLNSFGILNLSSNGISQIILIEEKESKNDYISDLMNVLNLSDFENLLIKTKNIYHTQIINLDSNLAQSIKNTNNGNIFDYMYLSAMTTTTLGFGDILPNAGSSRLAITIHAVLSVLFLAFAAIIISDKRQIDKKDENDNNQQ